MLFASAVLNLSSIKHDINILRFTQFIRIAEEAFALRPVQRLHLDRNEKLPPVTNDKVIIGPAQSKELGFWVF